MKKIKHFFTFLTLLGSLFFLFGPEVIPENFQFPELVNSVSQADVVIIFNSGGWGDTPLEKAEDFRPIIEGIQETLNDWGYNSIVIPYTRTKDNLFGRITGTREIFNSFQNSSDDLAEKIETIHKNLPDKKIIVAGLSNGASFVTKTYQEVSEDIKDSVYIIAVGTPFWTETLDSENILQLDNNGKDSLAKGDAKSLLLSLIKVPFLKAFCAPGHNYFWTSPEVNSQIVSFLENKFH